MMGNKERHFAPLIKVSLEELVPQDHFYRHLEQSLDLSFMREFVQQTYAHSGRPSIDPIVFFKLQLVMFFEGIRSERQLMRHAADRLSVRWYIGYDLGEPLPDHSSLTRIRERYGVDIFRRFFDAIVEQCQQEKLVWGRELYMDSTQVNANADLDSLTPRFAVEARAAIQSHLAALFAEEESQKEPQPAVAEVVAASSESTLTESRMCVMPTPLPLPLSQAEQEELAQDDAERHDWIAEQGRREPRSAGVLSAHLRPADQHDRSGCDADASEGGRHAPGLPRPLRRRWGQSQDHSPGLGHPSEVMDNQPMRDLIFRTRFRWKLRPRQVTGDTKYGTIENSKALEEAGIHAYVPLPDWEHQRPYFGPAQFRYDAEHDCYICPTGQRLHLSKMDYSGQRAGYSADPATCNACPLKAQCTPSDHGRLVHRSFHASYLERVRGYHQTHAYQKAMNKRKVWVEPLFAEAKDWHGLRRFRLRLLWRVNCEAVRIAAGQNLKRLLKKRGWGRRPFPMEALCASFWDLLPEVLVLFLKEWSFLMPIGSASSILRTAYSSLY